MSTSSSPPPPIDPGLHPIAQLIVAPTMRFAHVAAQGGLLLIGALVAALVWKNSSAAASYDALWATPLGIEVGSWRLELPLMLWINDGLMAVFFLVVGAEIKRELVVGELRGFKRAMVPALAAIGGMVVPAGLYLLLAGEHREGFGTPMATDIAFSLAAIRVLGGRVPDFVIKVLMGLAIIDDLGAIIVIAVFYGGDLHLDWLAFAGCLTLLLGALNVLGIWRTTPYVIVGLPLWYAVHHAGIHPTIAGVLVGLAIPARGVVNVDTIVDEARGLIGLAEKEADTIDEGDAATILSSLERRLEQHKAPLERIVEGFNPAI
ncbi:MAG TPA: Na+/H+ antiporter NhaA, partial [Myxococcota bacterium]